MTLMRWFPEIIEWIFGDDNEYQGYLKIVKELGSWVKSTSTTIIYINEWKQKYKPSSSLVKNHKLCRCAILFHGFLISN